MSLKAFLFTHLHGHFKSVRTKDVVFPGARREGESIILYHGIQINQTCAVDAEYFWTVSRASCYEMVVGKRWNLVLSHPENSSPSKLNINVSISVTAQPRCINADAGSLVLR